jgi:hypothetical protein
MEIVSENYVLSDGTRNMHISYVQPLSHGEGMLMAYLPKEKIAIEADLFNPGGATDAAAQLSFYNHVKRLGLDITTIAPIHGQPAPWRDFLKAVARKD